MKMPSVFATVVTSQVVVAVRALTPWRPATILSSPIRGDPQRPALPPGDLIAFTAPRRAAVANATAVTVRILTGESQISPNRAWTVTAGFRLHGPSRTAGRTVLFDLDAAKVTGTPHSIRDGRNVHA
jgi:hypothetical protein